MGFDSTDSQGGFIARRRHLRSASIKAKRFLDAGGRANFRAGAGY